MVAHNMHYRKVISFVSEMDVQYVNDMKTDTEVQLCRFNHMVRHHVTCMRLNNELFVTRQ